MARVYLDWNATAPLRDEAKQAMRDAMDVIGNPSSVHQEGRQVKALLENARADIAELMGCERADLVFTGSATEAAAMCFDPVSIAIGSQVEHDAIYSHLTTDHSIPVDHNGTYQIAETSEAFEAADVIALQSANSETGILQKTLPIAQHIWASDKKPLMVIDAVQALGKTKLRVDQTGGDFVIASPHKFGGPKGIGVLYVKTGLDPYKLVTGGGQEEGRRAGTENILGAVGAAAAAKAAKDDIANGIWEAVSDQRDWLEAELLNVAPEAIIFGKDTERLPNTSAIAIPGWKGETQVMQMDLAGFAISAGSACSSGKVKQSRVIKAMGFDNLTAQSTIRVSIGPDTPKSALESFVQAWTKAYQSYKAKAA